MALQFGKIGACDSGAPIYDPKFQQTAVDENGKPIGSPFGEHCFG